MWVNMRIAQNYNLNFLVDGLPAGMHRTLRGFPLGWFDPTPNHPTAYLNNHYEIAVDYHKVNAEENRVVGVMVIPSSRKDKGFW